MVVYLNNLYFKIVCYIYYQFCDIVTWCFRDLQYLAKLLLFLKYPLDSRTLVGSEILSNAPQYQREAW